MERSQSNIHIYLDIDGVLVTSNQLYSKNLHPKYQSHPFDKKCVDVLNRIIEVHNPTLILSSDWKFHYSIEQMNEILFDNGINHTISDITPNLWKVRFKSLSQLEECRASEIIKHADDNNIEKFVAVDDLDLSPWINDEHFVHTSRISEGIKQSGIFNKLNNKLNYYEE